jgi:hypothetical protein
MTALIAASTLLDADPVVLAVAAVVEADVVTLEEVALPPLVVTLAPAGTVTVTVTVETLTCREDEAAVVVVDEPVGAAADFTAALS